MLTKNNLEESFSNLIDQKLRADYDAVRAIPRESDMNQILDVTRHCKKKFDWALRTFLRLSKDEKPASESALKSRHIMITSDAGLSRVRLREMSEIAAESHKESPLRREYGGIVCIASGHQYGLQLASLIGTSVLQRSQITKDALRQLCQRLVQQEFPYYDHENNYYADCESNCSRLI